MNDYHAPAVTAERNLAGLLNDLSEILESDAEIKHGVEPVSPDYEAPAISEQRDLEGRLGFDSLQPPR